jgi:hypothetical protein
LPVSLQHGSRFSVLPGSPCNITCVLNTSRSHNMRIFREYYARVCTYLPKIWQPNQSSQRRTCNLKQIPKWGPTNFGRNSTEFIRLSYTCQVDVTPNLEGELSCGIIWSLNKEDTCYVCVAALMLRCEFTYTFDPLLRPMPCRFLNTFILYVIH